MKRLQNYLVAVIILFVANTASAITSDTVGVFDPAGFWHLRNSNSSGAADIPAFDYGGGDWKPVAGDWNGDGKDTIGVFDPTGKWHLRNSNSSGGADIPAFAYGAGDWTPVAGDWDGDGIDTIGVFDPAGFWHLRNSNSSGAADIIAFDYGGGNWIPVVGDWDGIPEPATALLGLIGMAGLGMRRRRVASDV